MPKPKKGTRLGGSSSHQRAMLSNLAAQVIIHGRITTTEAKAKSAKPVIERLITYAKKGDLSSRRKSLAILGDKSVVHHLFSEVAPRYANRDGGYTRILKLGNRTGDGAPMVIIELV